MAGLGVFLKDFHCFFLFMFLWFLLLFWVCLLLIQPASVFCQNVLFLEKR